MKAVRSSPVPDAGLFESGPSPAVGLDMIDGQVPYLTVDGILADPLRVRETALALDYSPGPANYPGRVARFPAADASLSQLLSKIIVLVESQYLPRLPELPNGARPSRVRGADTDFAITEVRPDDLSPAQRMPHTDAVPIFGLIYLNEEERGGTLFFKPKDRNARIEPADGYPASDDPNLTICGRIEGRFNRLAIYPGFIAHSGEIAGDWITGDERLRSPRLTQRIMFFI
jgi:hypothetical protein